MIIVGAGLAGLIAGHVFPNAMIIERDPAPQQHHGALLRFRSDAVSLVTGIPFRKVTVRKGVWVDGQFVEPNIRLANQYAIKCTGRAIARSIWDTAAVERFIAPNDFYARMVEACSARIKWGTEHGDAADITISTVPLHVSVERNLGMVNAVFDRSPIDVQRWRLLDNADVHQTIYFPSPHYSTYRASITGDILIIESMQGGNPMTISAVIEAFGLESERREAMGTIKQSYGKIAPIDERLRKELIHRLTTEANIYSVGRFATWRNILLDDVVKDLRIIRGMIEQNDAYSRRLHSL